MVIAIVEDNKEYSQTLLSFIQKFEKENNIIVDVKQYFNGYDFLDECQKYNFNIVFMDILMPGIDGMETAKRLRLVDDNVSIVFVTNMAQYAINGYEVGAIDFIVKPVDYTNFSLKFNKVLDVQSRKKNKKVKIKTAEGLISVNTTDIIYCETYGHYLNYHIKDGVITTRQSLKDAIESLGNEFKQCSKSFIVNLSYVRKITPTSIYVFNEKAQEIEIILSRKLKDQFISYLIDSGE